MEGFHLIDVLQDRRVWVPDPSGPFWVRSYFSIGMLHPFSLYNSIWNTRVPSKIQVFCVLFVLDAHDLQRRSPVISISPGCCILCRDEGEPANHLFLHCSYSFQVWLFFLKEFGLVWAMPKSCPELIELSPRSHSSLRGRILWKVAILAVFWGIWLERNGRLFKERMEGSSVLWDKIKLWFCTWVSRDKAPVCFTCLVQLNSV